MLKMWILVLHQASEQLWTEEEQARILPKISAFDEDSLQHVGFSCSFIAFVLINQLSVVDFTRTATCEV